MAPSANCTELTLFLPEEDFRFSPAAGKGRHSTRVEDMTSNQQNVSIGIWYIDSENDLLVDSSMQLEYKKSKEIIEMNNYMNDMSNNFGLYSSFGARSYDMTDDLMHSIA